jgi:hypothetical protein
VVEGYPTIALVAGGRVVRYSAVDRERVAEAISLWALATSAAIDAHAPNSGEPAPGIAVPEDAPRSKTREAFPDGRRGERAHEADEYFELSRARERQVREHARREERRVAERRRTAAKASAERVSQNKDAAEATTTAPKKSKRRAAREAAEASRRESEL